MAGRADNLTVITPATVFDMTTLEDAKVELGVTGDDQDDQILRWIAEESSAICAYTNRTWAEETVTETWFRYDRFWEELILERYPVTSITSIVEDGLTLETTDYLLSERDGIIIRLFQDQPTQWGAFKTVITYTGGYQLVGTLPSDIEKACLRSIKNRALTLTRDPSLRSLRLPGLQEEMYFQTTAQTTSGGSLSLSNEVTALLDPYREARIA